MVFEAEFYCINKHELLIVVGQCLKTLINKSDRLLFILFSIHFLFLFSCLLVLQPFNIISLISSWASLVVGQTGTTGVIHLSTLQPKQKWAWAKGLCTERKISQVLVTIATECLLSMRKREHQSYTKAMYFPWYGLEGSHGKS